MRGDKIEECLGRWEVLNDISLGLLTLVFYTCISRPPPPKKKKLACLFE